MAEKKGFEFSIKNGKIRCLRKSGELTLSGTRHREGATYTIDLYKDKSKTLRTSDSSVSWTNWHRQLAHLSIDDIKKLPAMATGIDSTNATRLESTESHPRICESYAIGKQHRQPVCIPRERATKVGEIVHTDIAGGGKLPQTLGGARYVLSIIDDYSNFMTVYLLKRKSQAEEVLKDYVLIMKNKGTPMLKLRSDNSREYAAPATQELLKNI